MNRLLLLCLSLLLSLGCGTRVKEGVPATSKRPVVAYVTNGIASFWTIAEAGALTAGKDFDAQVEVRMPPEGVGDQRRMVQELLTRDVDGIAISPIDPENEQDLLDEVAAQTRLITHDSDAPKSKRLAYIGMDNYDAGRMCGQLVKEAMPDGGSVMIFVGRLEQLNAQQRRQGVIDELLGRDHDAKRYDPPGQAIGEAGPGKYVILDTRTDGFDFGKAKSLAEDAISKYPDLGCMVGLFAYNPPYMLEALKGAGKQGQIRLVGFDEQAETLTAIADGHCYGTVVQNPYMYGYESVRVLAALTRGEDAKLPADGIVHIPARKITKRNVAGFQAELEKMLSAKKGPGGSETSKAAPATKPAVSPAAKKAVEVAFVTNNVSDFWKIAKAGVRKAEKDFAAKCDVREPPNGTTDEQQQIVEALMSRGVAGMAISPNDAVNQVSMIDRAAEQMPVLTHDSDSPGSKRLAYVGTNNVSAGRAAGKLIKEVLPNGGKIMLFVGRIDAQNAKDRAQGIRDELKDSEIEILDIRTDQTDRARAKQNVEDTINKYPDIGCLVGLWSYNGPAILGAVQGAGKLGKLPIVCFDEEDATLDGVAAGHIHATVVQQVYLFGYESVRILAALARGEDPGLPENKVVDIPVKIIRKDEASAYKDELVQLKKAAE